MAAKFSSDQPATASAKATPRRSADQMWQAILNQEKSKQYTDKTALALLEKVALSSKW